MIAGTCTSITSGDTGSRTTYPPRTTDLINTTKVEHMVASDWFLDGVRTKMLESLHFLAFANHVVVVNHNNLLACRRAHLQ